MSGPKSASGESGAPASILRFEMRDSSFEQEIVCGVLADGDGDGDGHAALAGGTVSGTDEGVGGLIEIGVGHDDHVILRAAESLHALAVLCAGGVDVLGDGGGADEGDGLDGGVGEDGVDGGLVAVDDVEDAVREAGFLEHFGEEDGGGGVALGGLEDEGVAAGDGEREHPERDHGGEVEGRDAGDDAERLAHGPGVDAGADLLGEFALEELADAGGVLDVFEAAHDLAFGVGEDFAVLAIEEGGDLVHAGLEDVAQAEEDAGAAERRLRGPVGEGAGGGFDGGVQLGFGCEGNVGLHGAGGRVEDVAETAGGAADGSAVDPVGDLADVCLFSGRFGCGREGGHGADSLEKEAPMVAGDFERCQG